MNCAYDSFLDGETRGFDDFVLSWVSQRNRVPSEFVSPCSFGWRRLADRQTEVAIDLTRRAEELRAAAAAASKPGFYNFTLRLAGVLGLLAAKLVQRWPPEQWLHAAMMQPYSGYDFPLSTRIARGVYRDAGAFGPLASATGNSRFVI